MRALVQRVERAQVDVGGRTTGKVGRGLLVFLGVGQADTDAEARLLWGKLSGLRVFEDTAGKTNLSLSDVGGQVLVVSQFTLYADCRHGRRPSFTQAGAPGEARRLYELFCSLVRESTGDVQTGEFGADMRVSLVNDGPFTLWLDTDELR